MLSLDTITAINCGFVVDYFAVVFFITKPQKTNSMKNQINIKPNTSSKIYLLEPHKSILNVSQQKAKLPKPA